MARPDRRWDCVPVAIDPGDAILDELRVESISQGVNGHAARGVDAEGRERGQHARRRNV